MAKKKENEYLDPRPALIEVCRIPEGVMHLRIGMFSADFDNGNKASVSNSGAALIIEIEDTKWSKKHKGELSPFRYIIEGRKLLDAVLERYDQDKIAGIGNIKNKR